MERDRRRRGAFNWKLLHQHDSDQARNESANQAPSKSQIALKTGMRNATESFSDTLVAIPNAVNPQNMHLAAQQAKGFLGMIFSPKTSYEAAKKSHQNVSNDYTLDPSQTMATLMGQAVGGTIAIGGLTAILTMLTRGKYLSTAFGKGMFKFTRSTLNKTRQAPLTNEPPTFLEKFFATMPLKTLYGSVLGMAAFIGGATLRERAYQELLKKYPKDHLKPLDDKNALLPVANVVDKIQVEGKQDKV